MNPVLELRRVSKSYPQHRALDDVSFLVPRGAFFCLVGPSGCGKTTALRLIAGFEPPTTGELLLNGARIEHLRPYERNVTTVFQNYALFPHMNARANIEFGLRRRHAADLKSPVDRVLQLLQLAGKESRHPHQLSGGERQRVALARSLVVQPDILLLDEPLSALDPKLRKQVRIELKSIQRQVGITFLMVTHDQEEALSLSDSIAVLNHGRIEQVGPPQDMYLHPGTRFVASFLGAINWIGPVGIRPESTRLSLDPPGSHLHSRAATVLHSTFLGNCFHIEAETADGFRAIAEIARNGLAFQPGQPVHLCWDPVDEIVLPPDPA